MGKRSVANGQEAMGERASMVKWKETLISHPSPSASSRASGLEES